MGNKNEYGDLRTCNPSAKLVLVIMSPLLGALPSDLAQRLTPSLSLHGLIPQDLRLILQSMSKLLQSHRTPLRLLWQFLAGGLFLGCRMWGCYLEVLEAF